jgi:hypothetical protein
LAHEAASEAEIQKTGQPGHWVEQILEFGVHLDSWQQRGKETAADWNEDGRRIIQ